MKVVAIDLDGVILKDDGWSGQDSFGEPLETTTWWHVLYRLGFTDIPKSNCKLHPREALETIRFNGYVIVIWTTRSREDLVAECLKNHGIPFDFINTNPHGPEDSSRKIMADYYIDNRAIEFNVEG